MALYFNKNEHFAMSSILLIQLLPDLKDIFLGGDVDGHNISIEIMNQTASETSELCAFIYTKMGNVYFLLSYSYRCWQILTKLWAIKFS